MDASSKCSYATKMHDAVCMRKLGDACTRTQERCDCLVQAKESACQGRRLAKVGKNEKPKTDKVIGAKGKTGKGKDAKGKDAKKHDKKHGKEHDKKHGKKSTKKHAK